jgi:type IV pilus assembly protein PilE
MKRGFTLLELIVVVIIIGILGTLGFTQYARMMEKARGAEARAILGDIRKQAAAYYLENATCLSYTSAMAGIGTGNDQIPSVCRGTHYFTYSINTVGVDYVRIVATRCTANGKAPQASTAGTLRLNTNFSPLSGSDTWDGTGGY